MGAEPSRTIIQPCGCCGTPRPIPNPDWLRWKRYETWGDTYLRQADIAKRAGVSVSFVQTVENGRRTCPEKLRAVYENL